MQRIALLSRPGSSDWISCQAITRNLSAAYRIAFPQAQIKTFHPDPDGSLYNAKEEAKRLLEFSPQWVSLIDHEPHPIYFFKFLAQLSPAPQASFDLNLHIFGDFPLNASQWIECTAALSQFKTRFICASNAQCALIHQFTNSQPIRVPFPVDSKQFHFSQQTSKHSSYDPFVFLYTGRLSQQKNILLLLQAFSVYSKEINPEAELWLAGPMDDIGLPHLGKPSQIGLFQTEFLRKMDNPKVRYLGNLNPDDLRSAYLNADAFISLSTHNDEDFGMAPAEALMCGLPCILTKWGGYGSFENINTKELPAVQLIPTQISGNKNYPTVGAAVKGLIALGSKKLTDSERSQISKRASDLYSIDAVAQQLKQTLSAPHEPFHNFQPIFLEVANVFKNSKRAPYLENGNYSKLYQELYAHYL